MTSVPGGESMISVAIDFWSCTFRIASIRTILSRFSQDIMLDLVIFFILPVDVVVMLPVVFSPAHPRFSLSYEKESLDCSFLRNLQDDSPIDGVSICEGVAAVDGIVFNSEICNRHPSLAREWALSVKPGSKWSLLRVSVNHLLFNQFSNLHLSNPPPRKSENNENGKKTLFGLKSPLCDFTMYLVRQ